MYEEKAGVASREVASTDTDQCAGAYNLVHGPFINRTMLYTKYVIPVANSEHKKCKYMGMDAIYSKECSKTWTVECKKGGNMCGSCSMIRNKRGGCSLLVMLKMWEASLQRGLEHREKTNLTMTRATLQRSQTTCLRRSDLSCVGKPLLR